MDFVLCHKDIDVLNFSFNDDFSKIKAVNEVYNEQHCPINLSMDVEKHQKISLKNGLAQWWNARSIPSSRQNLAEALNLLGKISISNIKANSLALSLSDHYWIKPIDNFPYTYKDVNFFENAFSDDVGNALFLNPSKSNKINLRTPDVTADGWLKKRWKILNGERYLLKGGNNSNHAEPYNEVITSEIANRLRLNHVDYFLIEDGEYSACKDMVSLKSELIPASRIACTKKRNNNHTQFESFLENCKLNGIENVESDLSKMVFFDYIIRNSDRQYNNFGFLRNPDTLEWIGLAPLYDNGTSLYHNVRTKNMLNKQEPYIVNVPFSSSLENQINQCNCKKYCKDLALDNLSDIGMFADKVFKTNMDFTDKRRELLCKALQERVEHLQSFMKGKIKTLPIPNYDKNYNIQGYD